MNKRQVVYSTNPFLKLIIQEKYFNDIHFVWCSEFFDSRDLPRLTSSAIIPPSSNPADIYRELRRDVERSDYHSAKITALKTTLIKLAIDFSDQGIITQDQKEEIAFMVNNASFEFWRPLVYVIPVEPALGRMQLVPINRRAGYGNEYIIPNLKRSEFDIIEV
jgi:hypothetical protein